MTAREKEKRSKKEEEDIKIDYDRIDVADIMNQIKRKIAKEPKHVPSEDIQMRESYPVPPVQYSPEPGVEEPAPGFKGKMKRVLLKIMKPVSPLIKLLVLPVHEQIVQTERKLHQTNMRLDYLDAKLTQELDKLNAALNNIEARLDEVNNATNQRVDQVNKTLNKIMEYTKLLHSLSHNLVVELSKLKIEEENLRSKTRIMEKDFEFLGKREKALEKEVFK
ncbi:MAG: hypothetical protein JSV96_15345 [Candidatus Aminicenantes bacterium]|nr:MAG: hypothetical protein JSV96_15345 [Candidatus Aminicenantes bacterium]